MALDGMAAVQARIQEIEQIIASRTQAAGAGAPMKATPAETAAQSSDFAALLAHSLSMIVFPQAPATLRMEPSFGWLRFGGRYSVTARRL